MEQPICVEEKQEQYWTYSCSFHNGSGGGQLFGCNGIVVVAMSTVDAAFS